LSIENEVTDFRPVKNGLNNVERQLESWWGPEGVRVEVTLGSAEWVAKCSSTQSRWVPKGSNICRVRAGRFSHETRGTFVEIIPLKRLKIRFMIDFIQGVEPYEYNLVVEFVSERRSVRMISTVDQHRRPRAVASRRFGLGEPTGEVAGGPCRTDEAEWR
jgi:hypothetical protein